MNGFFQQLETRRLKEKVLMRKLDLCTTAEASGAPSVNETSTPEKV
jgi:hypothetical protein